MRFSVYRSDAVAPAEFGAQNVLSFDAARGIVHTPGGLDPLRCVQQAARRLAGLGLSEIALLGSGWDFDAQWAFAQGFASAKRLGGVQFCGPESAQLDCLQKHVHWLKTQTNATPEALAPLQLAELAEQHIRSVAPAGSVSAQIISGSALADAGYVGIHGVGRGSNRPPALLSLDFNPTADAAAPVSVALVGKGITFDSGGYSIKESVGMLTMKCDMGGAALVSAALAHAIESGLRRRVKLFLCCAENLISGHAYKLGDVLSYRNGVSVEVVNTDAEGRLVLADGLLDAQSSNPGLIINAATLTGAAVTALGADYHALFAFDSALAQWYLQISEQQREPHWRLPLAPFHRSKCPSPYADTANSRPMKGGGPGGASNAAGFLSRFVQEQQPWIHLDLAAAFADSDTALFAAGATGLGLRTLSAALLERAS
jgi:PepB aminopeptidase